MAYFAKVAFPHISESTERANFRMAPVDSSLKVACTKVTSDATLDFHIRDLEMTPLRSSTDNGVSAIGLAIKICLVR